MAPVAAVTPAAAIALHAFGSAEEGEEKGGAGEEGRGAAPLAAEEVETVCDEEVEEGEVSLRRLGKLTGTGLGPFEPRPETEEERVRTM